MADSKPHDEAEYPPADDAIEDEAFAEFLRAADTGSISSREEFLRRFPSLEKQLGDLLDVADLIEGMIDAESSADADPVAETIAFDVRDPLTQEPNATLPLDAELSGEFQTGFELPYHFGDYRLDKVLGRGGMGVVYLAQQTGLERPVAVKMIRSGLLAGSDEVRRFYAEAKAAARLRHPNIVSVHHAGRHAGHHFFSMDYVPGTDLARRICSGVLSPHDAARYVRDVALAIDYAHKQGVLHRDLKPANVLLDEFDAVHVTDFGLAKTLDADSSLTRSGAAVGTPAYMAPEQASGMSDQASIPADVYSMGAILFALLAGRPPLEGTTAVETLVQVMHRPSPPIRKVRGDVPVDLETIIAKCLEKQPSRRYQSAAALADDLQRFIENRPIDARPRNALVRLGHWLADVPLVAALIGRRYTEAGPGHRRLQTALVAMTILLPLALVLGIYARRWYLSQMPSVVVIGAGPAEGRYIQFGQRLADRLEAMARIECQVRTSDGSIENRQQLLDAEVHLAMLQASALSGDQIAVVAPLYYEALHFLVHRDMTEIESVPDLRGHTLAVGPEGSASRLTAEMILDSFGMSFSDVVLRSDDWSELPEKDVPDAAIVVIAPGAPLVQKLIDSSYVVKEVPNTLAIAQDHPSLTALTIQPDAYPRAGIPAGGIATVGGPAFLAVRADAPDRLVRSALDALYGEDDPLTPDLIRRHRAAEWQGLALHPEARRYFAATSR